MVNGRRLVVELLVELRVRHCADDIVGERNGGSGGGTVGIGVGGSGGRCVQTVVSGVPQE